MTKTSIPERRRSNEATTPRSINRHDSKTSLTSSPWPQNMSYAAQQRALYTPKTSVRDRPVLHHKTTLKASPMDTNRHSVNTSYVPVKTYDSEYSLYPCAPKKKRRSSMEPPPPEPYPEGFEGLKDEEPDSSIEPYTKTDHCEQCGMKLRRRSFSSSM